VAEYQGLGGRVPGEQISTTAVIELGPLGNDRIRHVRCHELRCLTSALRADVATTLPQPSVVALIPTTECASHRVVGFEVSRGIHQ